jgi:hypothetical protein
MMTQDEIDMSPRAVAARLDEVRALYRLMLYLAKFTAVETAADPEAEASGRSSSEGIGGAGASPTGS